MLTRLPLRRITTTTRAAAAATAATRRHASNFGASPSPPKLPAKEQAEFERLQRAAAVSSAFQPAEAAAAAAAPENTTQATSTTGAAATESDLNEGGGLYRGARPEFDGDKNPRTGEVGGPKNEPLRWGSGGDWSYNGKVTDF
ncbi:Succinate dehydrogenase assembly factor 4, mitochondrial [Beauveria bassiana]|nr:Succinate dehydrogenase assembly factor 4, mitochondrial [Beauveria bassiana]KAH8709694.1 Succinate dehydrogenase assembly factor 4, mitochondrial [Beauveria bassiana]